MKNSPPSDYKVIKIFNNNVIFASQDKDEKILFGKGIGFGKHTGDIVPSTIVVDKIFTIEDKSNTKAFNELVNNIDSDLMGLCEEVICMISNELNEVLNEKIHVSLIDHITFTLKRLRENDEIENPFLVETETLYKNEFEVARKAVSMLEDRLKISIPDGEIGFITLHIHSARNQGKLSNTLKYAFLSSTIVEFLEDALNIEIDRQSLDYARFLTHIRFAIERILNNTPIKNELLDVIKKRYSTSYKLAKKAAKIIENGLGLEVIEDEIAYLAIHIQRFKSSLA
ncbi:glucose PTS transporter transcription antiterminator GlcT [Clostridium aciditolerans]|uniref:Transcription antiterminator n=1 Tax=Clostridium aciditolerans TaxID=339861 RepID=A0A934HY36_9CLOT|nr:transcription antiterminator [Clostridium aciditolerans]MBI6874144.1 transcription antiterminator [Clostridium aciditolerans]